jgi:serine protease Do
MYVCDWPRWLVLTGVLVVSTSTFAKGPSSFATVAAKAVRSVVSIKVEPVGSVPFPHRQDDDARPDSSTTSLGSGLIIGPDGYILTCAHVLAHAGLVHVTLASGRRYKARVVGVDRNSDLGLLKIDATGLHAAAIGSGAALKPGQPVAAIGAPYGFGHSVTAGVVSATSRHLASEKYISLIQTDVPINPGSSGGPLLDASGQVVGINSDIYSRQGGYTGVSFAVPIDVALNIVRQLKHDGEVARGWLGVGLSQVTAVEARKDGLKRPIGARVTHIVKHSPAAASELQVGDVIIAFNGVDVDAVRDVPPLVGSARIGDPATLEVVRDGSRVDIAVRIGRLERRDDDFIVALDKGRIDRFGMATRNITNSARADAPDRRGVVVQYAAGVARQAGIVPGDVVSRFDGHPVDNVDALHALEKHPADGKWVPVLIVHQHRSRFVAVRATPGS